MTERLKLLSEDELTAALEDAGRHVAYPPTPDLARSVVQRLETGAVPERLARRGWWTAGWRTAAAGLALTLFLFAGSLVVSPSWRRAVADFLGVSGIRIEVSDRLPTPLGGQLDLGERVSLAEAEESVTFDVLVPEALGAPDEVYFDQPPQDGQVSLVYRAGDGLPSASESGVGVLLTQFRGDVVDFAKKVLSAGTRIQAAQVDGFPAYWIEGAPHAFLYRDPDGDIVEETVRLADNVLLWEQGDITFRLESALSLDEAIRIAESLP